VHGQGRIDIGPDHRRKQKNITFERGKKETITFKLPRRLSTKKVIRPTTNQHNNNNNSNNKQQKHQRYRYCERYDKTTSNVTKSSRHKGHLRQRGADRRRRERRRKRFPNAKNSRLRANTTFPQNPTYPQIRLFRQSEEREPAPKDHLETKDTRENETPIEGAGKRRRSRKANSTRRTLSDSGVRRSGGQSRTISTTKTLRR